VTAAEARGTTAIEVPAVDRDLAGLYGPNSLTWRVNREAVLLLASGPRALLLQLAHPLIAEGVDQHSDFRHDPWSRLERTIRSFLKIVYGSAAEARGEIRRLNAYHRAIVGPIHDLGARRRFGPRYDARDPELSLWVHATLIDSTLAAYHAWIEPLTAGDRARLYDETRPIGRAFGIPESILPVDIDAFDRYYAAMRSPDGPIHPTDTARRLAHDVLYPRMNALIPFLGWVPPVLYAWTQWPSLALLPPDLRREFGIAWNPGHQAVADALAFGLRFGRFAFPTWLRWFPAAIRAEQRIRAAAELDEVGGLDL
jgi:uncharacterized protein (DUF2236 family)